MTPGRLRICQKKIHRTLGAGDRALSTSIFSSECVLVAYGPGIYACQSFISILFQVLEEFGLKEVDMKVISLIILGCASSIVVFGAQIKNETEVKNATLVLPDMDAVDDIVYNVNATQGAGIDDIDIDDKCITCLCQAATGCDLKYGCKEGYCGPFRMSRVYWIDAGKLTLPNDDTDRIGGRFSIFKVLLKSERIH